MKHYVHAYGGKNVIIFKNGTPANLGHWEREENVQTNWGRLNIYIGASGVWENKGDGGYDNWCFSGRFTQNGKHVQFH